MNNRNVNIVPVNKDEIRNSIEKSFEKFATGLKEVFEDITSLEVNTMVVSEIQGMKFYPEEAYFLLYNIPGESEKSYQKTYYEDNEKDNEKKSKKWQDRHLRERHMQLRERFDKVGQSIKIVIDGKETKLNRLPLPDPIVDIYEKENIQRIKKEINKELEENISQLKEKVTAPEFQINTQEIEEINKQIDELNNFKLRMEEFQQFQQRNSMLQDCLEKLEQFQEQGPTTENKNDIQKCQEIIKQRFQEQLKQLQKTTSENKKDIQECQNEISSLLQEDITTSEASGNIKELQGKISDLLQEDIKHLPESMKEKEEKRRTLLLENSEFLLRLRKLNELRSLLEGDAASQNNIYDLIYAQTVIQIDGDVMSRFDKKLFEPKEKEIREFLLSIHQESVISGEKNWREFLSFMRDLVESIANYFKKP